MSKLLEYGISENIPNKVYHADDFFTSSTAVKMLYYDIAKYEREYINKEKEDKPDNPAFAIGNYVHSLILEEDKVASEYAFFPDWDGRASGYQAFKKANVGKTVITQSQVLLVESMMKNYRKHPIASKFIIPAKKELTLCLDLHGVPVKVRFDSIDIDAGIIDDIKTSGFEVNQETFKMTGIGNQKYDISAALYTLAAETYFGKPFEFIFTCLSKKTHETAVFKTSEETMNTGKMKVKVGLERLKYYRENGKWPEMQKKVVIPTAEILEV